MHFIAFLKNRNLVMFKITGNGSCLFKAISFACYGGDHFEDTIKLRTVQEILDEGSKYQNLFDGLSPEDAAKTVADGGNLNGPEEAIITAEVLSCQVECIVVGPNKIFKNSVVYSPQNRNSAEIVTLLFWETTHHYDLLLTPGLSNLLHTLQEDEGWKLEYLANQIMGWYLKGSETDHESYQFENHEVASNEPPHKPLMVPDFSKNKFSSATEIKSPKRKQCKQNAIPKRKRKQTEPSQKEMEPEHPSADDSTCAQYLAKHNFKLKNVMGDGNCFFRAVSYIKYGTERRHQEIRIAAAEELVRNRHRYKDFLTDYGETIEQIAATVRTSGIEACDYAARATCNVLQAIIERHIPAYETHEPFFPHNGSTITYRLWLNNRHYQVIIPHTVKMHEFDPDVVSIDHEEKAESYGQNNLKHKIKPTTTGGMALPSHQSKSKTIPNDDVHQCPAKEDSESDEDEIEQKVNLVGSANYFLESDTDDEDDDEDVVVLGSRTTITEGDAGRMIGECDRYGHQFLAPKLFGSGRRYVDLLLLLPLHLKQMTLKETIAASKGYSGYYIFLYTNFAKERRNFVNDDDIASKFCVYYKRIPRSLKRRHKSRNIWMTELLVTHIIHTASKIKWMGINMQLLHAPSAGGLCRRLLENLTPESMCLLKKNCTKITSSLNALFCTNCTEVCQFKDCTWHISLDDMKPITTEKLQHNDIFLRYRVITGGSNSPLEIFKKLQTIYRNSGPASSLDTQKKNMQTVLECLHTHMHEEIINYYCCYMVLVMDGPNMSNYNASNLEEYLINPDVFKGVYVGECIGHTIRRSHSCDVGSAINRVLSRTTKIFMLRCVAHNTLFSAKKDEATVIELLKWFLYTHREERKTLPFFLLNKRSEISYLMHLDYEERKAIHCYPFLSIPVFTANQEEDYKGYMACNFSGNYKLTDITEKLSLPENVAFSDVKQNYLDHRNRVFT